MTTASTVRNEAFESWLSHVNQACGRFDARALDSDFYGELTEFHSGAINLSVVDMAHVHLYRTSKDVSTSSDGHYYAVFQMRGSSQLEQGDNRALLGCGDIALIDASRPSDMIYHEDSRQLSLILPRQVLERGYAWLSDENALAQTHATQIQTGQAVRATLADGDVSLVVTP